MSVIVILGIIAAIFCRGKIQDLSREINDMTKEVESFTQENATFLTFEKRYLYCLHYPEYFSIG